MIVHSRRVVAHSATSFGYGPRMTDDEERSPYLKASEVARHLRISTATVRRMVSDGELPALRIGKQLRIPRAALARLDSEGAR